MREIANRFRLPLAVALIAVGFATSLLAPNQSSASSPRHARVPPRAAVAAPSRTDVRSATDDASVLILLVLTLNSAGMVIRVASSPPTWMKD